MFSTQLKTLIVLSLLALNLAACGTPPTPTGAPGAVASPPTAAQPAETKTSREPGAQPGEVVQMPGVYQNDAFKISLHYPSGWRRLEGDPASGEKIGGAEGHFSTGALASGGLSLDELARSEADHVLQPFGSRPTIEAIEVQGREARLVLPSPDQPRLLPDEPAWGMLLVPYPRPVLVEKTLADYFTLYADLDHLRPLAGSLTFVEQPALFPPDSETPAAGICDLASDNPVEVILTLDVPSPRCMKLQAGHRLLLINRTGSALVARLAWYEIPLEAGERLLLDVAVGSFLAPGVHNLDQRGIGNSPALWLLP